MKATRTAETENGIIEITLTREVTGKTAYSDGYNLPVGYETYENYEVKMTHKASGKVVWVSGKPGSGFAFFETANQYNKLPAGAYARIGNAYVSEEVYNIAMSMIAELDAEVVKNAEYQEVEAKEIAREQPAEANLEAVAAKYASEIKNGLCPKCGSYCYGDCDA